MRAPCRVNLILPDPLTVKRNTLHILQTMIILITQLSPPLCCFFSCQELYNITLRQRQRQHDTLRICSIYLFIYLFTEVAPYCDKPCKYQAPRNVFNHMRLPSDVAVGKDTRIGQKISLHDVYIHS
jgi:hypothetical protein